MSWRLADDGADWLLLFADAVWQAATGARNFAEAVADLQHRWIEQAGRPRKGSSPLRLLELLPSNPVVNVQTISRRLAISKEAARLAIKRLEDAGILQQLTIGRRNRAWETVGLFDLLDRFERELGPASRTPRPTH